MYAVMISKSGLSSVVPKNSTAYPDMVMSGNYEEHFTGTQRECNDIHQELVESFGQEEI